jgi:hypothetical protein
MADYIAADPEVLLAGGVDLAKISAIIRQLEAELEWTSYAKYYTANGEDEITKVLDKVYLPSAEACREFVRMLKDLIVSHGQAVVDSGKVLSDADDIATGAAGGRRG